MFSEKRNASVEFLKFIADISDPATGTIDIERLASWLHMSTAELHDRWKSSAKRLPWKLFADELLDVLDAIQDRTLDLDRTTRWFRSVSISHFEMMTADEAVVKGSARRLSESIRAGQVVVEAAAQHGSL